MQVSEVHSDLRSLAYLNDGCRSQFDPLDGSLLCLWVQAVSWTDAFLEPSMEGDVEALPVNETSVSDIEILFMVSWLIGVSSCWLLAGLLRLSA